MPIYEYKCQKCDSQFEVLVRTPEDAACPECQSRKLNKLFSVPAVGRADAFGKTADSLPLAGGCGRQACAMGGCQGGFE